MWMATDQARFYPGVKEEQGSSVFNHTKQVSNDRIESDHSRQARRPRHRSASASPSRRTYRSRRALMTEFVTAFVADRTPSVFAKLPEGVGLRVVLRPGDSPLRQRYDPAPDRWGLPRLGPLRARGMPSGPSASGGFRVCVSTGLHIGSGWKAAWPRAMPSQLR